MDKRQVKLSSFMIGQVESKPRSYWWQCCVLIEPFEKKDYLKTDSRVPGSMEAHGAR